MGSLFFAFMSFAAMSTVLAVFENILACAMELTGWGRKKAAWICAAAMFALALPCAWGWSWLKGFHPMGGESTVLDAEDYLVSNLLLPLGALVYTLFCCHRFGWGWEAFRGEANQGRGLKVPGWARAYCAWVLPVLVLAIFVLGL